MELNNTITRGPLGLESRESRRVKTVVGNVLNVTRLVQCYKEHVVVTRYVFSTWLSLIILHGE